MKNEKIESNLAFYERFVEFGKQLTNDEAKALEKWEKQNVLGENSRATSDWPGWEAVYRRLSQ